MVFGMKKAAKEKYGNMQKIKLAAYYWGKTKIEMEIRKVNPGGQSLPKNEKKFDCGARSLHTRLQIFWGKKSIEH